MVETGLCIGIGIENGWETRQRQEVKKMNMDEQGSKGDVTNVRKHQVFFPEMNNCDHSYIFKSQQGDFEEKLQPAGRGYTPDR